MESKRVVDLKDVSVYLGEGRRGTAGPECFLRTFTASQTISVTRAML